MITNLQGGRQACAYLVRRRIFHDVPVNTGENRIFHNCPSCKKVVSFPAFCEIKLKQTARYGIMVSLYSDLYHRFRKVPNMTKVMKIILIPCWWCTGRRRPCLVRAREHAFRRGETIEKPTEDVSVTEQPEVITVISDDPHPVATRCPSTRQTAKRTASSTSCSSARIRAAKVSWKAPRGVRLHDARFLNKEKGTIT